MTQSDVSLIIADTDSHVLANNAIAACTACFNFSEVIVFTDEPNLWPQYKVMAINKIKSIDDYNQLVLNHFIETLKSDFCIISQFDGFIINGPLFSDSFYDFDYIGAVWPNYPHFRVGNGGFSWRSKRLMQAAASLSHLRPAMEAEDLFICRSMRVILEERFGCRFADEETAARFSFEIATQDVLSFGFHGLHNLPQIYRKNLPFLLENMTRGQLLKRLPYLVYGAEMLSIEERNLFNELVRQVLNETV